jgi:hypothetical protein
LLVVICWWRYILADVARGGRKNRSASAEQRTCANFVRNFEVWAFRFSRNEANERSLKKMNKQRKC